MFAALAVLHFDSRTTEGVDRKALHSITEKLRSRFPVVVKIHGTMEDDGEIRLAVAALMESEPKLAKMLDDFTSACETLGLGRVDDEVSILDDLDNFIEQATEESE